MDIFYEKVLDEELWEMHLTRQFTWTVNHRKAIYQKVDMKSCGKVLDVGCGIGLISAEIYALGVGEVHGIDINPKLIKKAREKFPNGQFVVGSGENLPYEDESFDCAFCNFLLMWVKNPAKVVSEMKRVTKTGGWIVCSAEPDYGAKIDYPDDFNAVPATIRALQMEGADPFFGRKLKAVLAREGLKPTMGVYAELWDDETMKREFEYIWKFGEKTARGTLQKNWLAAIRKRDQEALEKGERVTFLPLFWGIAKKE